MEITLNTSKKKILELGKVCSQKNNCCKHGSGFLAEDNLEKISAHLKISKEELKEKYLEEKEQFNKKLLKPRLKSKDKPFGECIFFKKGGCSIHEVKPLQCRIGNCTKEGEKLSAWFLLNYIVDKDDAESIRQYALYLKSGGKTLPGGRLEELVPEKDKLDKILNYEIMR